MSIACPRLMPPAQNPHQKLTFLDAIPPGESHMGWRYPIFGNVVCLHSHSSKNAPKMFFCQNWGFLPDTPKPSQQTENIYGPLNLRFWVIWTLQGCRSKSWHKTHQVEICERTSSCARQGVHCLGSSCTLPQTAAMFLSYLLFLRRTGTSNSANLLPFTGPLLLNLATKRWIVDFEGPPHLP